MVYMQLFSAGHVMDYVTGNLKGYHILALRIYDVSQSLTNQELICSELNNRHIEIFFCEVCASCCFIATRVSFAGQ